MVDLSGTNPGGMRMRAGGMQTPRLGAAAGGGYVVGGWIALCAMADVVILRDSSSSATTGAGAGWRMRDAQLVPWESCATTGQPPRDPSPRVRHSCLPSSQATVT